MQKLKTSLGNTSLSKYGTNENSTYENLTALSITWISVEHLLFRGWYLLVLHLCNNIKMITISYIYARICVLFAFITNHIKILQPSIHLIWSVGSSAIQWFIVCLESLRWHTRITFFIDLIGIIYLKYLPQ